MRWLPAIVAVAIALSGCALLTGRHDTRVRLGDETLYVPTNGEGVGYSDEMLSPTTYRISFAKARSAAGGTQGVMWHAAEVATARGFYGFAIMQHRDGANVEERGGNGVVCSTFGANTVCNRTRVRRSRTLETTIVVEMIPTRDETIAASKEPGALVYAAATIMRQLDDLKESLHEFH